MTPLRVISRKGVNILFYFICTVQRVTSYNVVRFISSINVPMYHVYKLKIRVFNYFFFSSLSTPLLSKGPSGYLATVKGYN